MIEVSKTKNEVFACNNCLVDGRYVDVYNISIVNDGHRASIRLCEGCFNEMAQKFKEATHD